MTWLRLMCIFSSRNWLPLYKARNLTLLFLFARFREEKENNKRKDVPGIALSAPSCAHQFPLVAKISGGTVVRFAIHISLLWKKEAAAVASSHVSFSKRQIISYISLAFVCFFTVFFCAVVSNS